jgi:hypothetical protein
MNKYDDPIERMKAALLELRAYNPLHNDFEEYLFDVATWGLGESPDIPDPAKCGLEPSKFIKAPND